MRRHRPAHRFVCGQCQQSRFTAFAQHPGWFITELNFHFRRTDERDSVMLEEKLLPALACVLPISIEAVDWWPVGRPQPAPAPGSPGGSSLKSLFTRWFGAG